MKNTHCNLAIRALSGGSYLLSGNIVEEKRGEATVMRSGDKIFSDHKDAEKNKAEAKKYAQEHLARVFELLD